uniref:RING-type domain-containing protein n=1 Tax=Globisporangium ultimum (strain ATCC 200006 / CBS 805.95 / DAOM BR144) TaxID=431595 RepID=K3X558_GLOUD
MKAMTPETVQYLDQLSFGMVANKHSDDKSSKDVQYILTIEHRSSGSQWTVGRSYRAYRDLQKRLLDAMKLGHFCNAECPWMYSFVKSQFPKECHFYSSTNYVINKRRDAFVKCFSMLHAHLLNRGNHSCSIVTNGVAMELIKFINEDLKQDSEHSWSSFTSADGETLFSDFNATELPMLEISVKYMNQSSDTSSSSSGSRRSRSSSRSRRASFSAPNECGLCGPSRGSAAAYDDANPEAHASDCESMASNDSFSFTKLSCGHEFHDECIIAKLNESMHCPTCGQAQV